jgi:hypothetical protein
VSDALDPLGRVGLEPLAPAGPPARVRRDDRGEQPKRERPHPAPEPDEDDDEGDGLPHVDVRA